MSGMANQFNPRNVIRPKLHASIMGRELFYENGFVAMIEPTQTSTRVVYLGGQVLDVAVELLKMGRKLDEESR